MQKRTEYLAEQKAELEAEGMGDLFTVSMQEELSNEYYETFSTLVKASYFKDLIVPTEVYKDLTPGQQFHFSKHFNMSFRGNIVS